MKEVRIGLGLNGNVAVGPRSVVGIAQAIEASGVVDDIVCWDQLCLAWPHHLWGEEVTPLARDVPDNASFCDVFVLAGIIAAATKNLGVTITADAVRRGPAELMQSMLTIAAATEGRGARVMLGAGEIKNIAPFGWPPRGGFDKVEDCLQIFQKFNEIRDPFAFEGKFWNFKDAWIGSARPYRPTFYALGGGPRIINAAARYADGLITAVPAAFPTPEQWGEEIVRVKRKVAEAGRDPDQFECGVNATCLIHDDPNVLDEACRNPLNLFIAALFGRFNTSEWAKVGQEAVFEDYHYAQDLVPELLSPAQTAQIVGQANPDMVRQTFITGSAAEVAERIQAYIDVGTTYVFVWDQIQFTRPLSERTSILNQEIELARLLKNPARFAISSR